MIFCLQRAKLVLLQVLIRKTPKTPLRKVELACKRMSGPGW